MSRAAPQSNAAKGDDGQVEVMRAFEFVLERLGHDAAAAELWADFIAFMSAAKPGSEAFRKLFEPEPGKEASKRALRLRELYLRALQVRRHTPALSGTWPPNPHLRSPIAAAERRQVRDRNVGPAKCEKGGSPRPRCERNGGRELLANYTPAHADGRLSDGVSASARVTLLRAQQRVQASPRRLAGE